RWVGRALGLIPGPFVQPALPGIAVDGMGPAGDRQLAGLDRCPAGRAYRQRMKFGPARVLEDDWLLSRVHVVVAPLLQRENDRSQVGTSFGQVILVARWVLGVHASLQHAELLEPA